MQIELDKLAIIIRAAAQAIRTAEISNVPNAHEYLANSEILAEAAVKATLKQLGLRT